VSNSIIIKFQPKGDKDLIRAIQSLALAQSRLEKNTKKVKEELHRLGVKGALATKHLRNVQTTSVGAASAFSVLRSKLLLASFGFTLFAGSVGRFAKAAGDAEEIANKFNVVFGDNADAVKTWAEAYGNSVGRATSSIMQFASTLQDTFVPMGFARSEATQLSTELTKLAIDVASFNNAADADVLNAFQSALVGNHETVRRYGIVITEASLQQEALRSGIVETNRPLTNQEKIQARLNLLMAGSQDAIGDAARTQESYANQVKALTEQWKEFSEELGEKLLPMITSLVGAMADLLKILDVNRVVGYTAAISTLAVTFFTLSKALKAARAGMLAFKISATKATFGLAALGFAAGELVSHLIDAEVELEEFEDTTESTTVSVVTLSDKLREKGGVFVQYAAILDKTKNSYIGLRDGIDQVQKLQLKLTQSMAEAGGRNVLAKNFLDAADSMNLAGISTDKLTKSVNIFFNEIAAGNRQDAFDTLKSGFKEFKGDALEASKGMEGFGKGIEKYTDSFRAFRDSFTKSSEQGKKDLEISEEMIALRAIEIQLAEKFAAVESERLLKTMLLMPSLEREIELLDLKNQFSGDEIFIETELLKLQKEGIILSDVEDVQESSELQRFKDKLKVKKDLLDATKLETAWANKLNSALLAGINNNARFAEAFANMLKQVAAQIAARAGVFALMNILTQGTFAGGLNMSSFLDYIGADIFHQGGQVQGYATGGMIPMSTYHSGGGVDNVPIMAQEGEFVMRRSAVESIGVENLNRMNRTGQSSGGVNVTFSGNVMSDDFVEDVAIPKIKDAIRRGADIGIS